MSSLQWIAVLVGLVGSLYGLARVPGFWRGTYGRNIEDNLAGGWPYGRRSLRGWVRVMPVLVVGAVTMFAAAALFGVANPNDPGSWTYALGYVGFLLILVTFACLILAAVIALFGRPQRLIPPWLREPPEG